MTRKYVSAFAFGAALCAVLMCWRGIFNNPDTERLYKILCDSFFIPSVLLIGVGLLTFAQSFGYFDSMGYSFEKMRYNMTGKGDGRARDLYEYGKMKKEDGKRDVKLHLIIVGVVFLIIAAWFQFEYTSNAATDSNSIAFTFSRSHATSSLPVS
jgi:hypothetical protein